MEHLVAIMLLVGCSADGSRCEEIPVPTPVYESVQACRSDLGLQMRLSGTYDTRVLGNCAEVSEDLMEQSATVAWAINKGGELLVEIEAEPAQVASVHAQDDGPQLASLASE